MAFCTLILSWTPRQSYEYRVEPREMLIVYTIWAGSLLVSFAIQNIHSPYQVFPREDGASRARGGRQVVADTRRLTM